MPLSRRVETGPLLQRLVDDPVPSHRAIHQSFRLLVVESHDPVGRMKNDVDQRGDGQTAGYFPARVAPHPVSDHQQVGRFLEL